MGIQHHMVWEQRSLVFVSPARERDLGPSFAHLMEPEELEEYPRGRPLRLWWQGGSWRWHGEMADLPEALRWHTSDQMERQTPRPKGW